MKLDKRMSAIIATYARIGTRAAIERSVNHEGKSFLRIQHKRLHKRMAQTSRPENISALDNLEKAKLADVANHTLVIACNSSDDPDSAHQLALPSAQACMTLLEKHHKELHPVLLKLEKEAELI